MIASRCCRKATLGRLAPLLLLTAHASAEPKSETQLTCLVGGGDLLASSPARGAEAPPWEGLAGWRSGDDNRVRLGVSADDVGFARGLTTSALLRFDLGLGATGQAGAPALRDVSSSLALSWQATSAARVVLRVYPFDTDYLRLGYLHALDWGGTDASRGESVFLRQRGGAPGLQISGTVPGAQLLFGLKWAKLDDALAGPRHRVGLLSGGSFRLSSALRLDAGFGYFQRNLGSNSLAPSHSFVEGASLRLVWSNGPDEPELTSEPFQPPSLREDAWRLAASMKPGAALALEGVALVTRAQRFEDSRQALVPAPAGALYGSVQGRWLRAHAVLTWRSLAFVTRNDARLAAGETLPASSVQQPELGAWLGASAETGRLPLVPSFEVGARLPAALESIGASGLLQSFVVGGLAGLEPLPSGAARLPVVAARLSLRLQASSSLALAVFSDYQRNPNRVVFVSSAAGAERAFAKPDSLALVAAAQARF